MRLLNFLRETFADALNLLRSPEGCSCRKLAYERRRKINSESNLSPFYATALEVLIRDIIASSSEIEKFEGFQVEVISNGRKSGLHRTDCD